MVRPTSAISEDVLHVRTADVWMGVVFAKSPRQTWRPSWSTSGTNRTNWAGLMMSVDRDRLEVRF
jgi:hypothetical protein